MRHAVEIVGAPVWERMEDAFRSWVRDDRYGEGYSDLNGSYDPIRSSSMRYLINVFLLSAAKGNTLASGRLWAPW